MRKVVTLVFAYLALTYVGVAWSGSNLNPDEAVSRAGIKFAKSGYSPFSISDGKGGLFHGEKELEQSVIFCALDNMDMQVRIYKVESIDENIRSFVTKYNTEMMRLLAEKKGCIR